MFFLNRPIFIINLVSVDSDWNPECSGQPEVCNLDAAILVNQQVLGLQIPKIEIYLL